MFNKKCEVSLMNEFLSEESIAMHSEYVRGKRLKYSIIESSVMGLHGLSVLDIYRLKMTDRDRRDSISLLTEIRLHEIFFSSFISSRYPHSDMVVRAYGSEASFLNELYRLCLLQHYGFVCVYQRRGKISADGFSDLENAFTHGEPLLAIDVCEHAYFLDYGFDKERYLVSALPYLDIARLSLDSD